MSNLWIVISREYMTRVKKKSFIILTILMPFLFVALGFVPVLLGMIKDDDAQRKVVVIDRTEKYLPVIIDAQKTDSTRASGYVFVTGAGDVQLYNTEDAEAEAVISITDTLSTHPDAIRIYSRGEVQNDLKRYLEDLLSNEIYREKLSRYNIPGLEKIVDDLHTDLYIKTIKWGDKGEETFSMSELAMLLGLILALLIYMFVLSYGSMVMQGVMEEKTNRIVEVIVSSVKPFHLMMGKVLGVMLVGLTQILIWGAMVTSLMLIGTTVFGISAGVDAASMTDAAAMSANMPGGVDMSAIEQNPLAEILTAFNNMPLAEIGVLFLLYFLGGYMLYASFFAAIGAAINSQEDSSQFLMPVIIIMVFSLYGAMGSMENTDGPLAFWASLFPLTSPIVMMVRLPFGVPLWQEALSVVLLFATAVGMIWISGRIYRVGILLYGKKPSFREMLKWLMYK